MSAVRKERVTKTSGNPSWLPDCCFEGISLREKIESLCRSQKMFAVDDRFR